MVLFFRHSSKTTIAHLMIRTSFQEANVTPGPNIKVQLPEMDNALKAILNYLNKERGFDFSGNRPSMLGRRTAKRLAATKCANFPEYLRYLKKAKEAIYPLESVKNVKYRLLKKYFVSIGESFRLTPKIRDLVTFASYDLLDKKSHAPPRERIRLF